MLIFSIGCMANQHIECSKPTHAKGSQWNPGEGWSVISDGPNNEMTQVPDDTEVVREFQQGLWNYNTIVCTYKFKDAQPLIIKHSIGCVRDNQPDSFSGGIRWDSYFCNTQANHLEVCSLDYCQLTRW